MYSITKNGKPLSKSLYTIDKINKTFSTNENCLVLDFRDEYGWTFKTGYDCTFNTGSYCTFKAGYGCIFKTNYGCTFDTGSYCTFKAGYDCTFNTGSYCTFNTGSGCVVVRRDVYEVIELDGSKKIKLNDLGVKGYTEIKDEPSLSGKEVEVVIDGKKYTAKII